jgi:sortase (surface protein transpeptidase)
MARFARRSLSTVAGLVGLLLVAIALFELVGPRDDTGSSTPTHRVDFDVRERAAPRPTTTTTTAVPRTAAPTTAAPTTSPPPIPLPVSVRIPALGIASPLIPLGLNADNTLEVPQDFAVAGWYTGRPVPGEVGPSIVVGHVDSKSGPAVFYRLNDVAAGMTVEVERSDGTVARFAVVAKEQHDKDAFPTEHVYGPTDTPQLRLITCGGTFDRSIGHYNDNLIVFADLIDIR